MDDKRLEDIRAREQAATPGPWININDGYITFGMQKMCIATSSGPNAEFIAHAREDVPALLDEIARLKAMVEDKEPCSFCSRQEEENIECCIAGEDFIEPNYCPMCGRKLEG